MIYFLLGPSFFAENAKQEKLMKEFHKPLYHKTALNQWICPDII